jgi:hypothetical protein
MSSFSPVQCSSFVRAMRPFLRSLIAATNASAFFPARALSSFFPCFGAFFCSTAPQAFFRPDHRFRTPSRAEAVKVGRRFAIEAHSDVSRPRLDSFEHGGRLDDHGPKKRLSSLVPFFRSRGLMSLPDPPFSTRSRVAGRNMAPGFRCRYVPNALSNAGRIARSSRPVPAGTTFRREMRRRDIRSTSGG